jgi:hypothetical protein
MPRGVRAGPSSAPSPNPPDRVPFLLSQLITLNLGTTCADILLTGDFEGPGLFAAPPSIIQLGGVVRLGVRG